MPPKKSSPKKAKKAAKEDKPKKPLSGYMLFSKQERPKVKADMPDATFGEVGRELGARWRALSDAQKAKYKKA
ncbi:hypothetical protein ACHAXT_002142 [Thalassiosira profunda]